VALSTLPGSQVLVTVGVDTHADSHVAVALDQLGRLLAPGRSPPPRPAMLRCLTGRPPSAGWIGSAWKAPAATALGSPAGCVLTVRSSPGVDRSDRAARRRHGKADDLDAHAAARAVQAGTATGQPKAGDGRVEMIGSLRLARRSAVKARTQAANQLKALLVTAPDVLRAQLRRLPLTELVSPPRPGCGPSPRRRPRPTRPSSRCGRSPAAGSS
jgi:transposase